MKILSQKPIAEKLQIKENRKVLLVNEPKDYMLSLGKLPPNVTVTINFSEKPFDIIQVFVNSRKELEDKLSALKPILAQKDILWVTYPKGTAIGRKSGFYPRICANSWVAGRKLSCRR